MLEKAARLADDRTELELDTFKVRGDAFEAGSLHRAEQSIGPSFSFSDFGHNGINVVGGASLPD